MEELVNQLIEQVTLLADLQKQSQSQLNNAFDLFNKRTEELDTLINNLNVVMESFHELNLNMDENITDLARVTAAMTQIVSYLKLEEASEEQEQ